MTDMNTLTHIVLSSPQLCVQLNSFELQLNASANRDETLKRKI